MLVSDKLTGTFLVALGAAAAYGGSLLPPVPGQQVGPNVFPMVVGVGLMLCGALIAAGVGSAIEEEAEADFAAHGGDTGSGQGSGGWSGLRALLPPFLVVFYVLVSERIGFIATSAIIILVAALSLGGKPKYVVPLAVVSPFVVHLVFYKVLRVPLPAGLIPTPW